jgi:hypothetical protein
VVFIGVDYLAAAFGVYVAATSWPSSSELRGMSMMAVRPEMLHLFWIKPSCVMEASLRRKPAGVKRISASPQPCPVTVFA